MRILFVILIVFLSSGCADLNSQFDCPMKPGIVCKSLDEVNSLVDQGQWAAGEGAGICAAKDKQ